MIERKYKIKKSYQLAKSDFNKRFYDLAHLKLIIHGKPVNTDKFKNFLSEQSYDELKISGLEESIHTIVKRTIKISQTITRSNLNHQKK